MHIITTASETQTKYLGKTLGKTFKGGEILALIGNLGSGKTTFLQGLAAGLGLKTKIKSPTFLICSHYPNKNFYHFDLYRLKNQRELLDLGFTEIIADPKNIVAIEWADKLKRHFPENTICLEFRYGHNPRERVISLWQKNS